MSQPKTREEEYLSAIASGSSTEMTPVTREEVFLAKATGQNVVVPEPRTRKEVFLRDVALSGAGGASVILKPATFTENGNYPASEFGADGFSSVEVDIDCEPAELWDERFTITGEPSEEGGSGGSGEMTGIGADIYVVYGGQLWDLFTFIGAAFPAFDTTRDNMVIAVADELPVLPETVERLNSYWVIKSTGMKYLRYNSMWIDFTTFSQQPDHGWISKEELEAIDYTSDSNIGAYAVERTCNPFVERNLTSLSGDYEVIGIFAFSSCDTLTSIDLPNATSIGNSAFRSCPVLTSADLPNATSIGDVAFYGCNALTSVIIRTLQVCTLDFSVFGGSTPIADGTGYIYVPADLVEAYKTATNWSEYASQIRAIEDYPEICG